MDEAPRGRPHVGEVASRGVKDVVEIRAAMVRRIERSYDGGAGFGGWTEHLRPRMRISLADEVARHIRARRHRRRVRGRPCATRATR